MGDLGNRDDRAPDRSQPPGGDEAGPTELKRAGRPPRQGLDKQQREAILALLTEPTLASAAAKVGVSPKTVQRWSQDEEFSREYRRAADEWLAQRYASMTSAWEQAQARLLELINSEHEAVALKALSLYYAQTGRQIDAVRRRTERSPMEELPEGLVRLIATSDDRLLQGAIP